MAVGHIFVGRPVTVLAEAYVARCSKHGSWSSLREGARSRLLPNLSTEWISTALRYASSFHCTRTRHYFLGSGCSFVVRGGHPQRRSVPFACDTHRIPWSRVLLVGVRRHEILASAPYLPLAGVDSTSHLWRAVRFSQMPSPSIYLALLNGRGGQGAASHLIYSA